jgi:hypothetical protein
MSADTLLTRNDPPAHSNCIKSCSDIGRLFFHNDPPKRYVVVVYATNLAGPPLEASQVVHGR